MAGLPENQNSVRVIEPAVGQSSKCSSRMRSGESVVITNGTACHSAVGNVVVTNGTACHTAVANVVVTNGTACHSAGRECSDHKRHGVPHLNPAGHDGFGLSVP